MNVRTRTLPRAVVDTDGGAWRRSTRDDRYVEDVPTARDGGGAGDGRARGSVGCLGGTGRGRVWAAERPRGRLVGVARDGAATHDRLGRTDDRSQGVAAQAGRLCVAL